MLPTGFHIFCAATKLAAARNRVEIKIQCFIFSRFQFTPTSFSSGFGIAHRWRGFCLGCSAYYPLGDDLYPRKVSRSGVRLLLFFARRFQLFAWHYPCQLINRRNSLPHHGRSKQTRSSASPWKASRCAFCSYPAKLCPYPAKNLQWETFLKKIQTYPESPGVSGFSTSLKSNFILFRQQ
jgi:hypothetical protein